MDTTLIGSAEAARRLGISPLLLRRALQHGLPLAATRTSAGHLRFAEDAVAACAQDRSWQPGAGRSRRSTDERSWELLALSPTPTVIVDAQSETPVAANDAALRLFGIGQAEFLALPREVAAAMLGSPSEWAAALPGAIGWTDGVVPDPSDPSRGYGAQQAGGPSLLRHLGDRTILLQRARQPGSYRGHAAFLVAGRDITAEVQAAALATASEALADTLDAEMLYPIILEQVARVLPCDRTHVLLLKGGWAVVAAAWGTPLLERDTRLYSLDRPASGWYPETMGEAAYLADALLEPTFIHAPECAPEQRARSVIGVPLMAGETRIGFFSVVSTTPNRYTPDHLRLARAFGERVTQAVRSAHLYALERDRSRAAEEMAAMRNEFVSSVSHELRTPLTAILGYAELLEQRWEQLDDSVRRDRLHRIAGAANRQLRLVEELLLLSHIGAGELEVQRVACVLAALGQRAIVELQDSYQQQQVLIAGDCNLMVLADGGRTVQIIVNLLDNAAKYSPEGSPVWLTWEREADTIAIRVRDSGRGMPEQERERLFTRFGRLPGSQTRAGRVGTGLGLYLSRHLAEAMGGSLDLEASDARGSTFRLQLPAAPSLAG